MKRLNLTFIIIFSTMVSVVIMGYYSNFVNKPRFYEINKSIKQVAVGNEKSYIPKENINNSNNNQCKVLEKVDEQISNKKDYLEKGELAKKELSQQQKSSDNLKKDIRSNTYLFETGDSIENSYYNIDQQEQSVFKVSTGKIQESLTTADKIKLLYVSFQLGKENYKKVEEYLCEQDAQEGVLKALKLLKEDLSKKEYEKVRKIAGKFIDMDAAELLK